METRNLGEILEAVLTKRQEEMEAEYAGRREGSPPKLSDFVSCSQSMQVLMDTVRRVVQADTSLLILGETGVGKELLARAIHADSARSQGPFVAVNCGGLSETLLDSELFGHEKGAFTGATNSRRGCFEIADGGTIFLDEIGEMSSQLQVKFLRVLQEHEFLRLGSEKPTRVHVRVMAATHRNLIEEVKAGRFREDLYYRLSVVTLTIPPLRERREDIPALVQRYINHFQARVRKENVRITLEALEALTRYAWPGNVRELMNVIERALLLCEGHEITLADLPEAIRATPAATNAAQVSLASVMGSKDIPEEWMEKPLHQVRHLVVRNFETAYLARLLRVTGGKVGETARRAGIHPRSLFDKMKRYGLSKEDFRPHTQAVH
jgi:DNA-binding NtrC family response regulator